MNLNNRRFPEAPASPQESKTSHIMVLFFEEMKSIRALLGRKGSPSITLILEVWVRNEPGWR
jgi:hypothetical protein